MQSEKIASDLGMAVLDIQANSPLGLNGQSVEAFICREYLLHGSNGVVTLTHDMIKDGVGIVAPTLRRMVATMVQSGRWAVVPGNGVFASTYQPLFLQELLATTGKDD